MVGLLLLSGAPRGDVGAGALVQVPARARPCVNFGGSLFAPDCELSFSDDSVESSRLLRALLLLSEEALSMSVL